MSRAATTLLAASLLVGACEAGIDEGQLGERKLDINGSILFEATCSGSQQGKIRQAMDFLFARLWSAPFEDCVRDAFTSADRDFSAESILDGLRSNQPTFIRCAYNSVEACDGNHDWDGCAPTNRADEYLTLDNDFVNDPATSIASIAAVITHEVAHNKGFKHPKGYEYAYAVNNQVQACMQTLMPNFARRSSMPLEAELAPVGGGGGEWFDQSCPDGQFLGGLRVGYDNLVRRIVPRCKQFDETRAGWLSGAGPTWTGLKQNSFCPAGQIVTGIFGHSGSVVDQVGLICSPIVNVRNRSSTFGIQQAAIGGSGGNAFERRCPLGQAVKRVLGRAGAAIDQMTLVCQDMSVPERGPYDHSLGVMGTRVGYHDEQRCSGFGAMVGLYGHSGSLVDRLGGICQPVNFKASVGDLAPDTTKEHAITAIDGGEGGSPFQTRCPAGTALVGIDGASGARVDLVKGICGRFSAWKIGRSIVWGTDAFDLPTYFGGTGGAPQREVCPVGEWLVGFESWARDGGAGIRGVRPVCRSLRADGPPPIDSRATLTVSRSGQGTVTSSPAGIDCGSTCIAGFLLGTVVTLTATPAAGYTFAGWSGDCSGTGSCQLTMNQGHDVTATFAQVQPAPAHLTVRLEASTSCAPGPSGRVTSTPAGLTCQMAAGQPIVCDASFALGTNVSLNAVTLDSRSTFLGYSGDCTSSTTTCNLVMNGNRTVTGTFCELIF